MGKKINLTGKKFGRWKVLKEAGQDKWRATMWECLCDCGKIDIIRGDALRRGKSRSCGCFNKEVASKRLTTHGMHGTKEHQIWNAMIQRCNNPNDVGYKNYGGRGITVCKRWLKIKNFIEDMGKCPTGLTIERRNNNLGYFKENCYWANWTDQARNRRTQKNKTGIKGVYLGKNRKHYAQICVNHKNIHLGFFDTLKEATEARKQAEIKYWGENHA